MRVVESFSVMLYGDAFAIESDEMSSLRLEDSPFESGARPFSFHSPTVSTLAVGASGSKNSKEQNSKR